MSEKKEYIERGALKAHYSWLPKDATLTPKDFDDIIDAQPAADVEPVVRGEWDKTKYKEHDFRTYFCSVCGKREYYFNATQYAYCPHCGAHMMERSGSGE